MEALYFAGPTLGNMLVVKLRQGFELSINGTRMNADDADKSKLSAFSALVRVQKRQLKNRGR